MKKEVIISATSVKKAIDEALEELGAKLEDVEFEVLEEPTKKLFGGTTNAKVRVLCISSPSGATKSSDDDCDSYNKKEEKKASENPKMSKEPDTLETKDQYSDENEVGNNKANNEEDEDEDEDEEQEDSYVIEEDELNFNKASKELTEEELDTIADAAIEAIRLILEYFGAEDTDIDEYEGEEGELILDIMGDNLAVLIGRHGKTIDAIQFLVSSIVYKKTGYRHPLLIDVKGYKHRRKQKIISVAKASAARAIRQKYDVRLRPMTPYERRIVHVALRDDKRVTTVSEGIEPNRYIVIKLK